MKNSSAIQPPDPINVIKLNNGLTCWLRPHLRPKNQIFLCLQFAVGSLLEQEHERGMCHFIEHLAFRGTAHFPGSDWINFLESLGHRFGTHQNAFTGHDQTNYFFSLAENSPETLDKALLGLADIAFQISFLPEAIEKERMVILEEYRNQQNPKAKIQKQKLHALFPDSRMASRDPLGIPKTIESFQAESLRAFYQRHYRPDQTLLLMAGDFEIEDAVKRLQHHFGSWPKPEQNPVAIAPQLQAPGPPKMFSFIDPTGQAARVEVTQFGTYFPLSSYAKFRRILLRNLAFLIFDRRLQNSINSRHLDAFEARSHCTSILNHRVMGKIAALGKPENLRAISEGLFSEIERVHRHGFLVEELESVSQILLQGAKDKLDVLGSRTSRELLWQMKKMGRDRTLPLEPETRYSLLKQFLPQIEIEEVSQAFIQQMPTRGAKLLITLPSSKYLSAPVRDDLQMMIDGIKSLQPLAPPKPLNIPELELAPLKTPSLILERWQVPDLDVAGLHFGNGIHFQCRPMAFHRKKFYLQLVIAAGKIQDEATQKGLTDGASQGLFKPATNLFLPAQFRMLLLEKNLRFSGTSAEDAIILNLAGHCDRLPFVLSIIHYLLSEVRLNEKVFKNWRDKKVLKAERLKTDSTNQVGQQFWKLVTNDDYRFRPLKAADLEQLTLTACQKRLASLIQKPPLGIAITGDLDQATMLNLANKYFASLPPRDPDHVPSQDNRTLALVTGPRIKTIALKTQDARCAIRLGWRSVPWHDITGRRHLSLAETILSKGLRQRIRQAKGLTYHIQCHSQLSKPFANGSFFFAEFTTDPDLAEQAAALAKTYLLNVAKNGISQADMEEARQQSLIRVHEAQQYPQYWAHWLSDFHYRGTRFQTLRSTAAFYKTCRRDEITSTLKRIMVEENFFQIIIQPLAP